MRVINWHSHVYPPEELSDSRFWMLSIDSLLTCNADAGVERVVVTNPLHYLRGRTLAECLDAIKRWTDYAAELKAAYPDRVEVFASTIPAAGKDFVRELERGVGELGLKGCFVNSSHDGMYPDEEQAWAFWEAASALDIPVMLHSPHCAFGEDRMDMYRLISSIARPMDETLSLARLIVRGLWERFPSVKLVGCHGGGGICEVIGRMDYAYELGDYCEFLGAYAPVLIHQAPSTYLRNMWIDTANYWPPALWSDIQSVGIEHTLFGADAPPLNPLLPKAIDLVNNLPIDQTEREAVFHANAERLLGLASPVAGAVA
ncbi:MAG: amidohydrolase family protein [Chloroflexi bacterium]|nr:amidohydrolase family protein [Chloroflexota bacterium]MBV9598516.1 amidohydrolase family protein [Chloroflexota bacterium]